MILPDEIVRIISEYSRPLKRRRISQFWVRRKVFDKITMMELVNKKYDAIYEHFWLPPLKYTEDALYTWNGYFAGGPELKLQEDRCEIQLIGTFKILTAT
jgi:hypothetical protein